MSVVYFCLVTDTCDCAAWDCLCLGLSYPKANKAYICYVVLTQLLKGKGVSRWYCICFISWAVFQLICCWGRKLLSGAEGTLQCNCQTSRKYLPCVGKEAGEEEESEEKRFGFSLLQLCPSTIPLLSVEVLLTYTSANHKRLWCHNFCRTHLLSVSKTQAHTECQRMLLSLLPFSSLSQPVLIIALVWLQISCWTLKVLIGAAEFMTFRGLFNASFWIPLKHWT